MESMENKKENNKKNTTANKRKTVSKKANTKVKEVDTKPKNIPEKKKTIKKQSKASNIGPKTILNQKETVKKEKTKKVISNKKQEEKEDKAKRIIKIIIIILLLLFLLWIFDVGEIIFDIPSKPEIKQEEEKWSNTNVVNISKDARTRAGVKYYLYCISKDKNSKNCKWNKTKTKNVVVKDNGINYVFIKAVNEDGKEGKISDPIEVKIDNEAPEIEKITKTVTTTTIKVKIDSIDKESGIDKYYYKIDDEEFTESSKNTYTFKDLTPDTTYKVTIKVVDKLGNEKEVEVDIKTKALSDDKNDTTNDDDKDNKNDNNNNNNSNSNSNNNNNNSNKNNSNNNNNNNNSNNNNNNNNNNKPNDKETTVEIKEIPKISLEKVPTIFTYGEKYTLPSSYTFGKKGGVVSCTVEGKEAKDTSTIGLGTKKIECTATSHTGPSVKISKVVQVELRKDEEKIFDGWITMNLYYPKNSTNWKWRLGKEETRKDEDCWKDYTGPITIKLTDVENVYIKYTLPSGEEVIVAPKNQLVVDIEPENYVIDKDQKTKVTINYSKEANTKEYRLNGGDWQNYTGEFEVGVDTQIDARAIKRENIYEGEELISSKNKISYDSVYISEKQEDSSETGGSDDGNQGTGGSDDGGSGSDKEDSNYTQIPDYVLEGPTIKVNPSLTITSSVKVKIETQEEAEEIYYKEGSNGKYKKYTQEFRVDENEMIYAYYITKEGQTSKVSEYNVSNIKIGEKPYINISLNRENLPKEVEVSISGEDYDTLEYSTNGKIYLPYEGSFKVTKNGSIYARATNKNGTTEEIKTITEFSSEPPIKEKLDVAILVNPDEKEVKGLINKAEVTINYDEKATNKYYKTSDTNWMPYTGSFKIEKNTTIYAYAENENAYGETVKSINYLTTGISGPTINANTTSPSQTVNITIDYSKNASVKKYKIDDGDYIDYTGPFNVDENCKIYAYNKDLLGNEAESSYTVSNIVEFTRELLIDKGDYFILKLNYPENSKPGSLKYKWSEDGEWENYDGQGILLIKKEYKDKIITDGDKAQIEDEYGNKITFTGNYYILETSISEMMANLYMKWEYKDLNRPDITISPTDATKVAKVIINYNDLSTEKLYKVVNPDGTTEGWKTYSLPIIIRKNNTVIYAKSYGENDTVSEEVTKLISNIDEENPKLNIVGDFETPIKKLSLQIIGEDDLGVERVGYAKGSHDAKYFEDKGEILKNRSVCNITENGVYTFYVEDAVGNITIKEIEITNINDNASDIDINVLTSTYGTEAEVEIDYGFNKTKQYKIGEKGSYKTYKEKFTIKSVDVLKYANPDGTLTLYARGVDANGEEQIEKEIIYVLDLDMPEAPNINVDSIIYPTVTLYGVESKIDVIIDYDDRDDINNYYSLDGGKTWELYEGPINIKPKSIIAKSVKKASGLEISSSKDPEKGSNALKYTGYDEDIKTCYGTGEDLSSQYFNIAPEMVGKYLKVYGGPTIYFYNSNDERFNSASASSSGTSVLVPEGAVKASISGYRGSVCDVMPDTEPVIETEYNYPTVYLHSVEAANNVATITYKETAVKKQYKIDDGKWKSYQGPIKLGIGETLYARSIDKNDHESIISTYKSENNSDALPTVGYDEDKNTCYYDQWGNVEHKYFEVAEEMIGARLKLYGTDTLYFYNKEGKEISSASVSTNPIVPEGTVKVRLYGYHSAICEVMADTTPIIETTYTYPKLYLHGMEKPYNTATISYRDMAIKKQYKINDGEWKDYTEPVKVKIGDIITARSIDKYGRPGIETTYKSENNSDALPQKAFDNDTTTCYNDGEWLNTKYFDVAEEMIGKTLIIYGGPSTYFYDSEGNELGYEKVDGKPVIPSGTVKARVYGYRSSICEIKIDTTPVIEYTYTYPEMTTSGMQDGYNTVTISYNELAAKRQYKINDEDWKEYTGPIRVEVGDNLTARSIDSYGNEGITASYESVLGPQAINPKIYDGDTTTCLDSDNGFKFTVNDDMIGQSIKMQGPDYYVYLYDQDSKQISVTHYNREQTIDVVEGTKSIMIAGGWTKICEVEPVITKARSKARARVKNTVESQIPTFEKEPTIDVSNRDKYTTSKDVNISYPNGYINEYSFDAKNWNTYKGKITVEENVTIYARTRKDSEIISTSSYKITKIDKGIPKISLDGIPDEVEVGSDYKIPSMYDFNSKSQNGTIECYANSQKISNIKELIEGTYNIKCTITTESGMKSSIEKSITIKSQKNNQEQQPNVEEKQIPSVEEKGTTPEIENENKNDEGENKNEEANKEETTNEQKINEETKEKSSE